MFDQNLDSQSSDPDDRENVPTKSSAPSPPSAPIFLDVATEKHLLFDGAIVALYPQTFFDSSVLLPVPDNQEVYVERDSNKSAIVEILQRVDADSDVEAMDIHIEDLIDGFEGVKRFTPIVESVIEIKYHGIPLRFPCIQQQLIMIPNQRFKGKLIEYGQANILSFALIRLESHKTDILVNANESNLYGTFHPKQDLIEDVFPDKMEQVHNVVNIILSEFNIRDWDLFGEDVSRSCMLGQ